ncbi:MAG: hypothetical protein HY326_06455 [Chloroflexi bacterium]|nr:hypothetical protein [Chloroflexota bacterium]
MAAATTILLGTTKGLLFVHQMAGALASVDSREPLPEMRWTLSHAALQGYNITGLVIHPDWPEVVYASASGTTHPEIGSGAGIFRSRNQGVTWEQNLQATVTALRGRTDRPEILYAGTEPAGVYRTTNAGDLWVEMETMTRLPHVASWWHPRPPYQPRIRTLTIDPHHPATVYAGVEVGGVVRSLDGGRTWEWPGAGLYSDIQVVAVDRNEPEQLLAATGAGIFRSEDYGRTWAVSNHGLLRTYMVALLQTGSVWLAVGALSPPFTWNETRSPDACWMRSLNNGATWDLCQGSDGYPLAGLDDAPLCLFADDSGGLLYAGTWRGQLYSSRDQGKHWTLLLGGLPTIQVLAVQ